MPTSPWRRAVVWIPALLIALSCRSTVSEPPIALTEDERALVAALVRDEAASLRKPRPILLLDSTDTSLPPDMSFPKPDDVPADAWEEMWRDHRLTAELRDANLQSYSIGRIDLPSGARLYPREQFHREYTTDEGTDRMLKRLGGVEPLVLEVSRPAISSDGEHASIVVTVYAVWTGCGGTNLYSASRLDGRWRLKLSSVLVFW